MLLSCILILSSYVPFPLNADTWYPPGHTHTTHGAAPRNHTQAARLHAAHTHHTQEHGDTLNPLVQGVRFSQKFISPVDSPRCPMYPTCSTYALQALQRHGPVVGSFLTVDRLLHETSPEEQTIPLEGFERIRYYDPLDANDFWLKSAKSPVEP
ncbi:MAG: membrane protein insertion efficiency factor YidD [Geobacteraceae bacterium]|nr:membrane protein insertion efficiency factor YidD [Geobacteraceae bacterium]